MSDFSGDDDDDGTDRWNGRQEEDQRDFRDISRMGSLYGGCGFEVVGVGEVGNGSDFVRSWPGEWYQVLIDVQVGCSLRIGTILTR